MRSACGSSKVWSWDARSVGGAIILSRWSNFQGANASDAWNLQSLGEDHSIQDVTQFLPAVSLGRAANGIVASAKPHLDRLAAARPGKRFGCFAKGPAPRTRAAQLERHEIVDMEDSAVLPQAFPDAIAEKAEQSALRANQAEQTSMRASVARIVRPLLRGHIGHRCPDQREGRVEQLFVNVNYGK